MSKTNLPAIQNSIQKGVTISTIDELKRIASMCIQSGFFSDTKDVAQAAVKIQRGLELGLQPMQSMESIHLIPGRGGAKVELSAQLMAALAKRAGYKLKFKSTDTECVVSWRDPDGEELGDSDFTVDDAKRAGLWGRGNWTKYPKDMLRARAVSRGARMFAPEVFLGVYVQGEISESPAIEEHVEAEIVEAVIEEKKNVEYEKSDERTELYRHLHALLKERRVDRIQYKQLLYIESMKQLSERDLRHSIDLFKPENMDELSEAWGNTPRDAKERFHPLLQLLKNVHKHTGGVVI